jgi:hypothetical protein
MAIAGIDDLTTALKGVLAGIAGLTAYAIEPASPKYPCAWVFFRQPAIDYAQDFAGGYTLHATITVAVQGTAEHQQSNIRPYVAAIGDRSILATIEDDPTLGLPGVNAAVLRVDEIGPIGAAGTNVWGATFPCDILVSEH